MVPDGTTIEFPGVLECRPYLDGCAVIDWYTAEIKDRTIKGVSIRSFDARTGDWSIVWLDNRRHRSAPDLSPLVGRFEAGIGRFYQETRADDQTVYVRFTWDRIGRDEARWTQAFSEDGEAWEDNWVMDFARTRRA